MMSKQSCTDAQIGFLSRLGIAVPPFLVGSLSTSNASDRAVRLRLMTALDPVGITARCMFGL
jgi:hypothetical protein